MEHLHGELLLAMGATPGGIRAAGRAYGRATLCCRVKAWAAERVDGGGTLESVK